MDEKKAERILGHIDRANRYLATNANYVPTSTGPRWQGKIKCMYCNHKGYAPEPGGDVSWDWWTQKHGLNCKRMGYWKYQNERNNHVNITYGSTVATGTIYSTSANTLGWTLNSNGSLYFNGRF
jgi:hypothetical protein